MDAERNVRLTSIVYIVVGILFMAGAAAVLSLLLVNPTGVFSGPFGFPGSALVVGWVLVGGVALYMGIRPLVDKKFFAAQVSRNKDPRVTLNRRLAGNVAYWALFLGVLLLAALITGGVFTQPGTIVTAIYCVLILGGLIYAVTYLILDQKR